ncbi:MAG: hypothetical protein ACKV2T_32745 [Kofleriaceae bacterium]
MTTESVTESVPESVTPTQAILAGVNQIIGYLPMLRAFFEHTDWHMTPAGWFMSSEEACTLAAKEPEAGAMTKVAHLHEAIADLPPAITSVRIDPGSPISLSIDTDRLDAFRRLARGARVESALAAGNLVLIKRHDAYFVPYFGELGKEYHIIAMPTPHGKMLAAFTAQDRVEAFLATGNDTDRANVKFTMLGGAQLFGSAATVAKGVIVNYGSPAPVGFLLDACREIMESDPLEVPVNP